MSENFVGYENIQLISSYGVQNLSEVIITKMMLDDIVNIQGLRVGMNRAMGPPVMGLVERQAKEPSASIPLMARSAVKKAEEKAWQ